MNAQLSIKKNKYVIYLMFELGKAKNELNDVMKNQKVWRCHSEQEFEYDIINYRIKQLEKQISKFEK